LKVSIINKDAETVIESFFEKEVGFLDEVRTKIIDKIAMDYVDNKVTFFADILNNGQISDKLLSCFLIWGMQVSLEIFHGALNEK
jgi:hypothetical protein